MVWSQYLEDINTLNSEQNQNNNNSEDDEVIPRNTPLDYDMWCTWFSNDLMNLWMTFKAYKEDTANERYLLDQADFDDFSRFCYEFSSKMRSKYPS